MINMAGNKTKRTNAGGRTKGKTKKFNVGGFMDTSPMSQTMAGGEGATGEVKKISQSAQTAAKQLGQASSAIGGGDMAGSSPYPGFSPPYGREVLPVIGAPTTYKKGGKVRGYGKARGNRACKMV